MALWWLGSSPPRRALARKKSCRASDVELSEETSQPFSVEGRKKVNRRGMMRPFLCFPLLFSTNDFKGLRRLQL